MQVMLGRKSLDQIFTVDLRVVEFYRGVEGSEAILGALAKSKVSADGHTEAEKCKRSRLRLR